MLNLGRSSGCGGRYHGRLCLPESTWSQNRGLAAVCCFISGGIFFFFTQAFEIFAEAAGHINADTACGGVMPHYSRERDS